MIVLNNIVKLFVLVPNQPTLTAKDSSNTEKTEHTNGDSVTLTCVSVGADGYIFYKIDTDGALITLNNEKKTDNTYIIDPFMIMSVGVYKCKAFNGDLQAADDSDTIALTLAGIVELSM